jgi:hypothetical protein
VFEGEPIYPLGVAIEVDGGAGDEIAMLEALSNDLPADGVGKSNVGPDVDAEPDVRPGSRRGSPRVDGVQAGTVVDSLEEVMEEDRVRLAGVRPPQNDEVGLFNLAI